ncbi:MAG TPA: YidC/Oxa1 family membrane protein insertase [Ktedonobacteraceae bacterium]|nr:YidC/Oxa1 family membrane protein insertase [Ktedonobacteraceae bacterium]
MGQIGYIFNLIFTFPIFNVLMLLYRTIGDFGLSIIVLTLIVRLVLFPLTLKQLRSMKAMQALQPQLAEIRKKYKDQKAQLEATQALYKEYGVNPVAGSCLPLLVQMPVLFALFYALNAVLRNATLTSINALIYPFLPKFTTPPNVNLTWFTFINPSWHIALGSPDPTHILPILAAVATFIQLRMSQARTNATKTTSGGKDITSQQMVIMQIISPLMVLFFGWTYAAGLALYWTTSSVFGMVQQYFVTGWGSLTVIPNFGGNKNVANGKSAAKPTSVVAQPKEPEVVDSTLERGPSGNTPKKSQYSSSTAARRRSRNNSASARRRGGNVPKRNPSRS